VKAAVVKERCHVLLTSMWAIWRLVILASVVALPPACGLLISSRPPTLMLEHRRPESSVRLTAPVWMAMPSALIALMGKVMQETLADGKESCEASHSLGATVYIAIALPR
jgi:hypothetical protein